MSFVVLCIDTHYKNHDKNSAFNIIKRMIYGSGQNYKNKVVCLCVSEFSSTLSLLRLIYHLVLLIESNMLCPNIDLESFQIYVCSLEENRTEKMHF